MQLEGLETNGMMATVVPASQKTEKDFLGTPGTPVGYRYPAWVHIPSSMRGTGVNVRGTGVNVRGTQMTFMPSTGGKTIVRTYQRHLVFQ